MTRASAMQSDRLALLGGKPISPVIIERPAWPPIDDETSRRLLETYQSRLWSFHSPAEQKFASDFARYHGAKHGIFMANGTITLQAALQAVGVGPGDEVIVPAITWLATATAAAYLGAIPVFVDVEPSTLCMDPRQVRANLSPKTRAILPVHLMGSMANLDELCKIAAEHNLQLIEDCAHMHGGFWDGRGVGTIGRIGSFSFQQSKTMTSGEGGICITNDDQLADRLFRIKHMGYTPVDAQGSPSNFPPQGLLCHNFRATAFQATVLQVQLEKLHERITRYNAKIARLEKHFAGLPGVRVQSRGLKAGPQGYYAWILLFDQEPLNRIPMDRIREAIVAEGIKMIGRPYAPVYKFGLFNLPPGQFRVQPGGCPVAEYLCERAVTLLHPWFDADDDTIDRIGEIFARVIRHGTELA